MKVEPLTGVAVTLKYTTKDARRDVTWDSKKSNTTPNRTLISAAAELARIAEIAGCGADLEAAVADARARVVLWREQHEGET